MEHKFKRGTVVVVQRAPLRKNYVVEGGPGWIHRMKDLKGCVGIIDRSGQFPLGTTATGVKYYKVDFESDAQDGASWFLLGDDLEIAPPLLQLKYGGNVGGGA